MKNPYDVYNDNRAYHGYLRAISDVMELVIELEDEDGKIDKEELLNGLEVEG